MSQGFMNFYRSVRSNLENPKDLDWILHTNLGPLYMQRLEACEQNAIICIHCHDEAGNYRYIAFTESQIANFPIEVKKRASSQTECGAIGFKFTRSGEDVTGTESINGG